MLDGDGMAINDAMVEVWQADAQGRYAHPSDGGARPNTKFMGFGRSATDKNGVFSFDTISQVRCRDRMARLRRHTLCSVSSRAECCGRSTPVSILPTRPPTTAILSSRWCRLTGVGLSLPTKRFGVGSCLPLRHPGPGRERNRFLRHLKFRWRRLLPGRRPRELARPTLPTNSDHDVGRAPLFGIPPIAGLSDLSRFRITSFFTYGIDPTHFAHLSHF